MVNKKFIVIPLTILGVIFVGPMLLIWLAFGGLSFLIGTTTYWIFPCFLNLFIPYFIVKKLPISTISKIPIFIIISFILGVNTNIPLFIKNNILNRPKIEMHIGDKVYMPDKGSRYIVMSTYLDHSNYLPSEYYVSPYRLESGSESMNIELSPFFGKLINVLGGVNGYRYMDNKTINSSFYKKRNRQRLSIVNKSGDEERFVSRNRNFTTKETIPKYIIAIRLNRVTNNTQRLEIYITDSSGYVQSWFYKGNYSTIKINKDRNLDNYYYGQFVSENIIEGIIHNNIWGYMLNKIDPYQNTDDISDFINKATNPTVSRDFPEIQNREIKTENKFDVINKIIVSDIFYGIEAYYDAYNHLPINTTNGITMTADSATVKKLINEVARVRSLSPNYDLSSPLLSKTYVTYDGKAYSVCFNPISNMFEEDYETTKYTKDGEIVENSGGDKCPDSNNENCFWCLYSN